MSYELLMIIAESAVIAVVIQLAIIIGLLGMIKDLKLRNKTNSRLAMAVLKRKKQLTTRY